MAVEYCCFRLNFTRNVLLHNLYLSQQFNGNIRGMCPAIQYCWPFKMNTLLKYQNIMSRPLLASFQPYICLSKMGLKHQTSHRRNFVKETKLHESTKPGKSRDVIKGVRRAIQDKQIKLHQTEERWKRSRQEIYADIRETRKKMKEKMGEIIERENIWTVPNLLCVSRIGMSPYLGYLILEQDFHWALGVLTVAGITDLLDGWIARTFKNQSSKIGSFLDPVADKILIATMFLSLTYVGIIPVPLTGLIITRDVALVTAGFIIRYKSLPPPRTLSRYFDVTHATAQLAPTFVSKVNTMVQLLTVACTLAAPVFDYLDHPALHGLWYLTAGTTVASAGSYLLSKNTFKFLKKSSK